MHVNAHRWVMKQTELIRIRTNNVLFSHFLQSCALRTLFPLPSTSHSLKSPPSTVPSQLKVLKASSLNKTLLPFQLKPFRSLSKLLPSRSSCLAYACGKGHRLLQPITAHLLLPLVSHLTGFFRSPWPQKFGPGTTDREKEANTSSKTDALRPWLLAPSPGLMPTYWLSLVGTYIGSWRH